MLDLTQHRASVLGTRKLANEKVSISAAPATSRIILRAAGDDVAVAAKALGVVLPELPKSTARHGNVNALWIGPDEWFIYAPEAENLAARLADLTGTISAVDVSHRNAAVLISGPASRSVIAAACPQNLNDDVFPVGAASRTVFGHAEIILHRTGKEDWRIECWRSFADYVWDFASDSMKLNVV